MTDLYFNLGPDFDPDLSAHYHSFVWQGYAFVGHWPELSLAHGYLAGSSSLENPEGALIDGSYIAGVLSTVRPINIAWPLAGVFGPTGPQIDWFNLQVLDLLETVVGVCGGGSVSQVSTSSVVLMNCIQIIKTQYRIDCNGDHGTGTTGFVAWIPYRELPPDNFVNNVIINTVQKIKPGFVGSGFSINLGPLTQAVQDIARKDVTLQSGDSGPIVNFSSSEVLEP